MEAPFGKEALTILRRLIAYSEKLFRFSETVVAGIVDRRLQPRIPTAAEIWQAALARIKSESPSIETQNRSNLAALRICTRAPWNGTSADCKGKWHAKWPNA